MSDIDGLLKEVELMKRANELADKYVSGKDEFSENIYDYNGSLPAEDGVE